MMYKVQPGDYLSKIATQHGVADWRVIYDHPNNASFRQLRPNPNLISPGDQLFIPDRGTKSLPAQTGSPARFRAHRARNTLQVKLLDHAGNPLANQACKLEYDGTSRPVTTDGSGVLRETVPPALSEALLIVNGVSMTLAIGHLNPMDNAPDHGVSGVQRDAEKRRLRALPARKRVSLARRYGGTAFSATSSRSARGCRVLPGRARYCRRGSRRARSRVITGS